MPELGAVRAALCHCLSAKAIADQTTCALSYDARLRLALHYWVKWNLLGDRWATRSFQVETMNVGEIASVWCTHCEKAKTCVCPRTAKAVVLNTSSTSASARVRPTKGHGHRRASITWEQLLSIDPGMTRVALAMTLEYGYLLNGTNTTMAG